MATNIRHKGALKLAKSKTWELSYKPFGTDTVKTKQITTTIATESRILVAYNTGSKDYYFKAVKLSQYA